jgi:hypothetical protein
LALTGSSSFDREGWSFAPVSEKTALATVGWNESRHHLTIAATGGIFLGPQQGLRVDVWRRFNEFELGWFVVANSLKTNGGFTFRIPLPPSTRPFPKAMRIRMADVFPWQYQYHSFVTSGKAFKPGDQMEWLIRAINPSIYR